MTNFLKPYREQAKFRLILFFGLTFAITWGLSLIYFLAPDILNQIGGPNPDDPYRNWLYYVAVYAPTISALILIAIFDGVSGFKRFFGALLAPGRPLQWTLWVFIGLAIWPLGWVLFDFFAKMFGLEAMIGGADVCKLALSVPALLFGSTYLAMDPGPVGEEPGWRGYAMPRLLCVMGPIAAGALLGLIWGIWHLPAFLISDSSQSDLNFLWFCVSLTSQGIVMTWIYLRSGGNWLAAGILPHAVINGSASIGAFAIGQMMYPLTPLLFALLICVFDPIMRRR